ncbi:chemotaxis protein CheD [Marivirga arenosa]|nr:chemotaxis protein CheD [Marivirga sp. ABR2-2]WKK86644.2 chemotaxis protein CheD [Marivirga sp. ABR2-2]
MLELILKEHFVHPGMLRVSRFKEIIWTVLGSCVAVVLHDKENKYSGMNHFMLPYWNQKDAPTEMYGDIATERLIKKFEAMGSKIENLEARIVGGSEQINKTFEIGKKNVAVAEKILSTYKIKVVGRQTGGASGRKLKLLTHSGKLFIKNLN